MTPQILYLTLAALAFGLALNLKLSMAVLRTAYPPEALLAGQSVPAVLARGLDGGHPIALVATHQVGVALWLVSEEPGWRLRAFLRDCALTALAA
jgi:hypothetical protein